ncbi:peptidase C14 caspase catalytic subunit p20 [Scytonema sp. HK-05]|uniref:caspase family protein n=1 Tax=Scytonema sp. HK-05 TaxID=1137095 RepID=UPI000937287A|nr:caspase family protein [Scytonema sp. HK-05]OKH48577.1 peptidase C14 [Scytonema sp. HK-05]BAY43831.1 peptidase C14 caspase catalytic subunit p20 [Scytonema sp. HK-05]
MANNWAIAIGINQYQFFQPLSCAQTDAEAIRDFLVTQGGFLPQQCLLMTETSPPFRERSTYPTKENIFLLFEDLAATCWRPQDRLWFFFSGYGVNHKGQDYLMPVEGDPNRIEETGIEVRALMQSLQVAALDALLLFDINRAFGTHADARVGKETIELAKELQIPIILSCQPDEFSHESSELGHGFFTAALLEALRYGNRTNLANLEKYLSVRTPELCQHYWRPTQTPITIFVSKPQVISPQLEEKSEPRVKELAQVAPNNSLSSPQLPSSPAPSLPISPSPQLPSSLTPSSSSSSSLPHSLTPSSPSSPSSPDPHKRSSNNQFLPHLLLGSIATILLLCLIVVVLLRDRKLAQILPASSKLASNNTKVVKVSPKPSPTASPIVLAQPEIQSTPQVTSSSQVTPSADESKQRNQALLELEKMSLSPTQASDLRQAINTARKIQPGEPLYTQAQDNIKIWSRMILDLAQDRAKQKLYAGAISAAQLVPKDQLVYPKAQTSINQWRLEAKQYVSNTTLIDAAVGLIRSGQASSYNRAIEVAKKVPQGEPGFDVAQKSIDSWSENILQLAKTRAARREFQAAIATAALVPEGTAAYKKAQNAITEWEKNSQ